MADQKDRIAFLKDALKKLAKSVREVSKGLIDLDKILSRVTGNTKTFAAEQKKAAASMDKTKKSVKEVSDETKKYEKNAKKATTTSKGFFSTFAKNIKTIASFYAGFLALSLVVKGLQELFVNSTKRAIAFEKALADLQAVAGLTSSEVDRLEKVVFKVAGSTSLTTLEVVELQKQLAKLGSSAAEIEQLTKPIALLSQALGEDAGGVAATLKKTLNQFQQTSEEADRFANILTGAVNETALSLTDLGNALSYVGPLGAQMGISFEETSSLLGILADNGFKASKAGTGLRKFFTEAAKDGRPFNDFLEDIASRNLSAAEAFELFGRTGASQALVLSKNIDTYRELSVELSDNTRLLKANAIQMSTNQGQLDLLSSAYDKVSTKIGGFFIKSKILIGVMQLLDPQTAALSESYGILSSDSDVLNEKIDTLANSMRIFGEASDSVNTSNLSQALGIILESGTFSDEQVRLFEKSISYWRELGKSELEAVNSIISTQSGFVKRIALTTREILKVAQASAKQLDDEAIAIKANDETVKDYTQSVLNLKTAAAEGNDISSDKITLYDSLNREINQNISAQNLVIKKGIEATAAEKDGFIVTEKRIELLKSLLTSLNVLSTDEDKLSAKNKVRIDREQNDLKNQLKDQIERIKETEKVISELPENVSDLVFSQQTDLMTSFFGTADEIVADAEARFGKDSKFAVGLRNSLEETGQSVSIELPAPAPVTVEQKISTINTDTEEAIALLNERQLSETLIAESVEQRADIEAETFQLTRDIYEQQAIDIRELNSEYENQTDVIEEAAKSADDLAKIYDSDIIISVNKAVADYTKELADLDKQLKDGTINQEEYNKQKNSLKEALNSNIDAFESIKQLSPAVLSYFDKLQEKLFPDIKPKSGIGESISDLIEDLENVNWAELAEKAVSEIDEIVDAFSETRFENKKNELEQEIDLIKARYDIESDIIKSQLDNQLITESQFRQKQNELRKSQVSAENDVDKKIFESDKQQDVRDAQNDGIVAAANVVIKALEKYGPTAKAAIAAAAGISVVGLQTGLKVSAINQKKFYPKKFADGGVVNGPSHSEGGVPFSVQGRGGYEMEGGEYIINKKATSMHRDLLERINGSYKTNSNSPKVRFADGGIVNSLASSNINPNISLINSQPLSVSIEKESDESVDYLKAIAEATTSTAIGVSKPVRAFVADKDLRTDSNERRIRDRNDRI